MTYPATTYAEGVELTITSGNQLHEIINGDATEEINTESGMVPSVRKALADSMLFKPAIAWAEGSVESDPFQTRIYGEGIYWAPAASNETPISMGSNPTTDSNWFLAPVTGGESISRNTNLLSNHNFITKSPDDITHPSVTPTDYVAGTQIFSGIFVGDDIVGLTHIDGRVSWTSGTLYFSVPNSGALEYVDQTDFVASVADFDGKPRTRGVSYALVGDEYRVTVGVDALEDESANETLLGSVKFEQGSVATRHEVQSAKGQLYTFDSVSEMASSGAPLRSIVRTNKYNVDVLSIWVVMTSIPITHTEGINAIQLNGGNYAILLSDDGDVRHCGAGLVVVANEGPLWNASIKHVNKAFIPKQSTSYAREIELADYTYIRVEGSLRHTPNSPTWSRVFTNKDRVNGNKGFTVDFTGGEAHGNKNNQPEVNQHYFLFINCEDCLWVGGTLKENRALNDDGSEISLTPHPDGPFNQGVKRGEPSYTSIDSGFGYWIGGKNNHALGGIKLLNWQKEGFSMRWVDTSSIGQIEGISGPERSYSEYAPVDWTTRAGVQTLNIGDHILVQDGHEYNGEEQQPYLIYESLISGSVDLGSEDYTDNARWSLVLRDISEDYGYTVARITGSTVGNNSIYDGNGSFCRASTFSNDSELCVMSNLTSYHNSYNVGINFGHANSPTNGSRASNLIAINPGWAGGTSGSSYGINVVSGSRDVSIDTFLVCGAGRNALNVSDNADKVKASNGTIKFSEAAGARSSNAQLDLTNVTSKSNGGDDFEASGTGVISLNNCRDSRDVLLNNERLIESDRSGQTELTLFIGDQGKKRNGWRDTFSTPAGSPIVTLVGLGSNSDSMNMTVEYSERNSGSNSAANQRTCKTTFHISGSGSARTVQILNEHYQLNRKFRAEWDVGLNTVNIYLQDLVPVDVSANDTNNWIDVEIKNHTYQYSLGLG